MQVGNVSYCGAEDFPAAVPVFPLGGVLLLPGGQLPLNIFEPRYIAMFDDAMASDRLIAMVQPRGEIDRDAGAGAADKRANQDALAGTGGLGRIVSFNETGDGRYVVTLSGICRVRLLDEVSEETPYRRFRVAPFLADLDEENEGSTVDRDALLDTFRAYLEANSMEADWDSVKRASNHTLVNALSMMSPFGPAEKQALLEAADLRTRAETLVAITEVHLARESAGDGHSRLQ